MISVIVPCLNEANNLPRFLDSMRAQLFPQDLLGLWDGCELVIIDGGSTDRSREIVDAYSEARQTTKLLDLRRNLGAVRNRGAAAARGDVLLFTNSDAIFSEFFLLDVAGEFFASDLQALSGRTVPLQGGFLSSLAYAAFDWLRWFMSKFGRFSPSGNFLAIRKDVFWRVHGFPEIRVNEDGELGQRISRARVKVKFARQLLTYHVMKKKRSGWRSLAFYAYVFGNFSPFLKRILCPIERKSALEFNRK